MELPLGSGWDETYVTRAGDACAAASAPAAAAAAAAADKHVACAGWLPDGTVWAILQVMVIVMVKVMVMMMMMMIMMMMMMMMMIMIMIMMQVVHHSSAGPSSAATVPQTVQHPACCPSTLKNCNISTHACMNSAALQKCHNGVASVAVTFIAVTFVAVTSVAGMVVMEAGDV